MRLLLRRSALPIGLLLLLSACSASLPSLRGHQDTLRQRIHRAKSLGSMDCAPEALASAQAHYRFGVMEMEQGNLGRAEQHLIVGLVSADEAVEAGTSCSSSGVSAKDLLADPWPDADGDAVTGDKDLCPYAIEDRDGFDDHDGCPEPDNDLDGVLDKEDRCPNVPEDPDGFGDSDGCPEDDNDEDGVADEDDACPSKAETFNSFQDDDGCPDFRPDFVDIAGDRIAFRKPLSFVDKSPLLLRSSHPPLRELAALLSQNPEVKVRIEGHTDNRGETDRLQQLSEGRARSVMDYLVTQGIDASRMEALGLGDAKPISTNRTASGRTKNRRIEILVVEGGLRSVTGPL